MFATKEPAYVIKFKSFAKALLHIYGLKFISDMFLFPGYKMGK